MLGEAGFAGDIASLAWKSGFLPPEAILFWGWH